MSNTPRWQKSSYSSEGNNCLELAHAQEGTAYIRESHTPEVVLATDSARLRSLLAWASRQPTL